MRIGSFVILSNLRTMQKALLFTDTETIAYNENKALTINYQ